MAEKRRLAFLGIGHPLRRDDAAGVEVCRRIALGLDGRDDVLVVDGGPSPENCIGALRAFAPQLVIVVDAARMGQPPGTLMRIDPSDPRVGGASTHTLPLPAFCDYLETTLGCDVTLLGVEPADTSFGEGLTPAVARAVERAANEALTQFKSSLSASPPCPLSADSLDVTEGSWRRGGGNLGEGGSKAPPFPQKTPSPPPASGNRTRFLPMQGEGLGVGVRSILARKHILSEPIGSAFGRFRGPEKERTP